MDHDLAGFIALGVIVLLIACSIGTCTVIEKSNETTRATACIEASKVWDGTRCYTTHTGETYN